MPKSSIIRPVGSGLFASSPPAPGLVDEIVNVHGVYADSVVEDVIGVGGVAEEDLSDSLVVSGAVSEDLEGSTGTWRENEPAGWTTQFDAHMDYPGITTTTHPFFQIDNSPLEGQWPTVQEELFTTDAIRLLEASGGPVSPPHVANFFFPGGLGDGQRSAFMDGLLSDTSVGVYFAYTMRLSANWSQGGTGSVNGVKHVEIRASGVGPFARTNIAREVSSGDNQYTVRYNHVGVGHLPRVNVEATRFAPGEWLNIEALLRFNTAGAGTGSMSSWVNGVLACHEDPKDVSKPGTVVRLRNLNVFGGGIGSVPQDQFIDIGHFYASVG